MCAHQIKHRKPKISGLFRTAPAHPSLHRVWCPSFPSKNRILNPVVFCQMLADSLQPLEHSAAAQPPELCVRTINHQGFAECSVVYGLTEHSACCYFKWYSTGLCRRINWNFLVSPLGQTPFQTGGDVREVLVATGNEGLYGQHVAFGQREPVWLLHTAFEVN